MYTTLLRQDQEAAPISNGLNLLGYARAAYNGVNMIQVFAANSIMQRRLQPDAQILLMTVPYKIKEE